MLLALNDDEGHAKRLAEAGLTRTNRWWETTASWFPKFVADTFYFGDPLKILEIGSYEGGSTIWFQRFLLSHPNSSLLSVDTWSDARDPQSYSPTGDVGNQPTSLTQQRYLSNVKAVSNGDKVTAVKSDSARALAALLSSQNGDDDDDPQFDFVYVDGSHRASEILIDVSLAWRLLKVGGLMLLDDYLFASPAPNNVATIRNEGDGICATTIVERLEANATVAIDTVLAAVPGGAEVLHCGYQLLVRKRASSFSGDESRQAPVVLLRGVNGHQNLFLT